MNGHLIRNPIVIVVSAIVVVAFIIFNRLRHSRRHGVYAGRYMAGHPALHAPQGNVRIQFGNGNAVIMERSVVNFIPIASIPLGAITDVKPSTTMRIGRKALFPDLNRRGIWALLNSTTTEYSVFHVSVQWGDGDGVHYTEFEFDNEEAEQDAINLTAEFLKNMSV